MVCIPSFRDTHPRFLRLASGALFALSLIGAPGDARAEAVAVELILATDCSSSVQPEEYTLLVRGVAVTLVQWSGESMQTQALPWPHVHDKESAAAFTKQVEELPQYMQWGATAIGEALSFSVGLFEDNGFEGVRQVIDVSGDSSSNQGEFPTVVRPLVIAAGVTINGLAVLNDEPNLDKYYKEQVIGGKRSFVERAKDFADFGAAIRRKLIREIGSPPSAQLDTQIARAR